MNIKEKFIDPAAEFVIFSKQDIVTTSGNTVTTPATPGIELPDDDLTNNK